MSKISELSDGGALQSTDYLIAVRSGGNVKVQANGAASFTTLTASGDVNFDSGTFFVDASADAVGIGTSSPSSYPVASDLVVDTGTNGGITIKSGTSNYGGVFFADGTTGNEQYRGFVQYNHNYAGSTDELLFGTSGTEAMRIDSSGNVGIGTSSPGGHRLKVEGGTTYLLDHLYIAGGLGKMVSSDSASNPLIFGRNASEDMRIDSSGNVGIGTSSPTDALSVGTLGSGGSTVITIGASTTGISSLYFGDGTGAARFRGYFDYYHSSDALAIGTAGSEKARIDSSGNVLVGTTSTNPGQNNTDTGTAIYSGGRFMMQNSGSDNIMGRNTDGVLLSIRRSGSEVGSISVTTSATAYNTSSDARLKENIADAEDASSLVDAIKVRQFDWKADGSHQRYGMVAQELLEVAPEAVSGDPKSDDMMGVDYSKLVPMLVKEIQSLRARVAQLEGV